MVDRQRSRRDRMGEARRFVVAGGFNTVVTYALFWMLSFTLHHQLAFVLAFAVGVGFAYVLNTRFVFAVRGSAQMAAGYPLIYLATYAINSLVLEAGVRWLDWSPRWALLPAIAVSVPASFLLNRWWLARHPRRSNAA